MYEFGSYKGEKTLLEGGVFLGTYGTVIACNSTPPPLLCTLFKLAHPAFYNNCDKTKNRYIQCILMCKCATVKMELIGCLASQATK